MEQEKFEFKGALLEEFKKALKAVADNASDEPIMFINGVHYSHRKIYEAVEQQTEFGKIFISKVEDLCNSGIFTPEELIGLMYQSADFYKSRKTYPEHSPS